MSIPIRPVAPDQTRIELGSRGENEALIIRWAALLPKWRETYGAGTVVLLHQRLGDTQPYPATIQVEGDNIDWTVTAADTARAGQGSCELQYIVEDSVVKSKRWQTLVFCSLEEPGPAPEPVEGWVRQLVESTDAAVAAGLAELREAGSAGVEDLQESRTAGLEALQEAQTAGLEALRETATEGCTALQETGETARAAVEEARSQAEQQLAGMAQSYSKGESDARYAPIQSALTVSAAGDDLVTLSPTVPWALQGLKLFGRTVQDGVPSPEHPVPLVSAGDNGTTPVSLYSTNLLSGVSYSTDHGLTLSKNEDGTFSLNGTGTGDSPIGLYFLGTYGDLTLKFPKGDYSYYVSGLPSGSNIRIRTTANNELTASSDSQLVVTQNDIAQVLIILQPNQTFSNTIIKPVLLVGNSAQEKFYSASTPSGLTISTPNGLPGIPVDDGGNYTDSSGQQWISNTLDFSAGLETIVLAQIDSYNGEEIPGAYMSTTGALTTGATVIYALSTPTTQPIDAETLAAYQALQSYYGTTNVICDGVGIQATALADATQYVSDLSQRIAALESVQTNL